MPKQIIDAASRRHTFGSSEKRSPDRAPLEAADAERAGEESRGLSVGEGLMVVINADAGRVRTQMSGRLGEVIFRQIAVEFGG